MGCRQDPLCLQLCLCQLNHSSCCSVHSGDDVRRSLLARLQQTVILQALVSCAESTGTATVKVRSAGGFRP